MRILLDTHAFLWWVTDSAHLSRNAFTAIEDRDNEILISPITPWELATKHRVGKLQEAKSILGDLERTMDTNGFRPLPISIAHTRLAGLMPGDHRDPFDRMLAAQAKLEGVPLVTSDKAFRDFPIETLW